jgi:S1-C subfamily serine protease
MGEWFLQIEGRESGPFSVDELVFLAKEGRLSATDQVRRGTTGQWTAAASVVKGLKPERSAVAETPAAAEEASAEDAESRRAPPPLPVRSSSVWGGSGTLAIAAVVGLSVVVVIGVIWSRMGSDEPIATAAPTTVPPNDATSLGDLVSPKVIAEIGTPPGDLREEPKGDEKGLPPSMPRTSVADSPGPKSKMVESMKGRDAQKLVSKAVGKVVLGWRLVNKDGEKKETGGSLLYFCANEREAQQLKKKGHTIGVIRSKSGKSIFYERVLGSSGTCFFVTADGIALTNSHVVKKFEQVQRARGKIREIKGDYEFNELKPLMWIIVDGEPHEATVKFISEEFDLAVVKIELEDSPFFRLSTLDEPTLLTEVMAVGFPGAATVELTQEDGDDFRARLSRSRHMKSSPLCEQKITLTKGEVSSISNRPKIGQLIQHDANINPGNSGGPLWESQSRAVIGINTFGIPSANGVFFALQMRQMRTEIDDNVPGIRWYSPSDSK